MTDCAHPSFDAGVEVNRLEDSGQFVAEVRIRCAECQQPFQFLGLKPGLDLQGATMDITGEEARLSIAPAGTIPRPIDGLRGFDVTLHDPEGG